MPRLEARLLVTGASDCARNMALDEALLHLWRPGDPPVLRLYTWRPTGLSLGRGQALDEVDVGEARRLGVCVVRRPTGGAAIVHPEAGELTYSIVLGTDHPGLPPGVEESARRIAEALLRGLQRLGIPARLVDEPYRGEGPPLCYLRGGRASIAVNGFKVSGSAQLRLGRRLLQHGTIVLRVDPQLWARLLRMKVEEVASSVRGLIDLGYQVSLDELVEAVAAGFEEVLGLSLHRDDVREEEAALAESLRYKYESEAWLAGVRRAFRTER